MPDRPHPWTSVRGCYLSLLPLANRVLVTISNTVEEVEAGQIILGESQIGLNPIEVSLQAPRVNQNLYICWIVKVYVLPFIRS